MNLSHWAKNHLAPLSRHRLISSPPSANVASSVPVRTWQCQEASSVLPARSVEFLKFTPAQSAVIVMDPTRNHHNVQHDADYRSVLPAIIEVLKWAEEVGAKTILYTSGLPVYRELAPGSGLRYDFVFSNEHSVKDSSEVTKFFEQNQIETIFYTGGASNLCILSKPLGFRALLPLNWGRKFGLIREATVSFESCNTRESRTLEEAAFYEFEYAWPNGFTIALSDLVRA